MDHFAGSFFYDLGRYAAVAVVLLIIGVVCWFFERSK